MRKTKTSLPALLAGLISIWVVPVCSADESVSHVRSASMLANTCAGCHGTNGASAGELMPIIGGLEKEYMTTVLSEYKSGERSSTIMGRIAKGYSDNELKAIASYLSRQPWVSSPVKTDTKLAAQGKEIHENECKTCHEEGGRVQEDEAPRLAGQWPDFTLLYLKECHAKGRRCQPRKMGKRVSKLSADELKALAHYYASEK